MEHREPEDSILANASDYRDRLPDLLRDARGKLRDHGKLVIADPDRRLDERKLVVALSEAGFALIEPSLSSGPTDRYLARKEHFSIREYREGDEDQIVPMFRRRFHVDRGLPRWRWVYRENPRGNLRISLAFSEDGTLAAQYAGYPVTFEKTVAGEEQTLNALQIGDTMTAPEFHNAGKGPTQLLMRTLRDFYARYCQGQVAFNYGFNTGKIHRFSLRSANARRLEDIPFHVLEVSRASFQTAWSSVAQLLAYRVQRVDHFDANWDQFYDRVRAAYALLVKRDSRYLEWRYARCADRQYFIYAVRRWGRMVGWSVFRRDGSRLIWGDALFDPNAPSAVRLLLKHVLMSPEHRGAETIETWASTRPGWWHAQIAKLGFVGRPEPNDLSLVFVPFNHDPENDFRAHLYYTMGDSDLF